MSTSAYVHSTLATTIIIVCNPIRKSKNTWGDVQQSLKPYFF